MLARRHVVLTTDRGECPPLDKLQLSVRTDVLRMLIKVGEGSEHVCFSDTIVKINRRCREQLRILLITDKAIYNLKPTELSKCRRRIGLESIVSVTVSDSSSNEFVIHIPEEYDYRYKSPRKSDIVNCLSLHHQTLSKKKLAVKHIRASALKNMTITKDVARGLSRTDIMLRKKQLAYEEHESDREEDNFGDDATLLTNSKDKVSLDNFDLLKVVGRGSFGKVMLVRERASGIIYAMKILKKSAVIARNQIEHTKSERKILQTLQHPFIMGLKYAFQTQEKLYFVLDYYKGGELFFHLKHKRRFSEEIARFFIAQVGLAIGHLHSHQIVYRDLKPENILMDEQGNLCLTDFGLSKDIDNNEQAHTFAGTPEYLSPEVISDSGHGKAVDWWSLGILLYELTVGIPPFYSQNVHEMYQKIQTGPLKFPPFLSPSCKDLITKLLNRNPASRLGSSEMDFEEIRVHPFFKPINWEKLFRKEIPPPYVPVVNGADCDTSNFDSQFTNEPAVDSFVSESFLVPKDSQGFDQFTYVGAKSHLR